MPARQRKETEPEMGPDGEIEVSPEELENEALHDDAEGDQMPDQMIYDGEILISGMTLAVKLPGDGRESYFPAKFIARKQPGESDNDLAARVITVVRETAISQIDDAVDALAEYQQQLAARLNR